MREIFERLAGALTRHLFFIVAMSVLPLAFPAAAGAQVTIAQISDTHLGEAEAPNAAENLRRTVEMVNARRPDAVVLSGDIGENPEEWQRAREILKGLNAPLYYAPGNHDVHSRDVEQYRGVFGPDYYSFQVRGITFLVIDSQLLGNFDQFEARSPLPLPAETQAEAEKMLDWLGQQRAGRGNQRRRHWWSRARDGDGDEDRGGGTVIAIQHIPAARNNDLPPDSKPYWVVNDPYRSRELELLHKLGIRHVLAGHWHVGTTFTADGITWHVAPSTGRLLPWSGSLGFAMHTITGEGQVRTEFVPLGQ
jgi:3',5'-cyclic AMP phosphodiesterase CpdA